MAGKRIKRFAQLVVKYGEFLVLEQVAEEIAARAYSFGRMWLQARVINIPGEIMVTENLMDFVQDLPDFSFFDRDFNRANVARNSKTPKAGIYKLVYFCPDIFPEGIGVIEFCAFMRWHGFCQTNLDELLSVENSCDLRALGLGDSYKLVSLATVIKRSSARFSFCYPIVEVTVLESEEDGVWAKDRSLLLRDAFIPRPADHYFLVRVK